MDGNALEECLAGHQERGDLLALLKEAKIRFGALSPALLADLAKGLGMRVGDLYGIVSFYSFLTTAPVGRHNIRLCQCVPCRLGNGETVLAAIERELHLKPGQTTLDGRFTLQLTNCIGGCGGTPAMMVDDRRFGNLTEESVAAVLADFD